MRSRIIAAVALLIIIASACIGFVLTASADTPIDSVEPMNAEVLKREFNGTTAWMLYRVDEKIYLLEKAGYGKPEVSIWMEEDELCD